MVIFYSSEQYLRLLCGLNGYGLNRRHQTVDILDSRIIFRINLSQLVLARLQLHAEISLTQLVEGCHQILDWCKSSFSHEILQGKNDKQRNRQS
ncbi:hypothetical protein D3C77_368550 [compost metagenome]